MPPMQRWLLPSRSPLPIPKLETWVAGVLQRCTLWRAYFLDFRGPAPASAAANMYLDEAGDVIPDASTTGVGAATVPGTVAGLWELHRRFGRLPWRIDLAPAIRYAHRGFTVHALLHRVRDGRAAKLNGRTNFLAHFGAFKSGDTFRQPDLAATLERIATDGRRDFYQGHTADLCVAEIVRNGGRLNHADLAQYRAVWRKPLRGRWRAMR